MATKKKDKTLKALLAEIGISPVSPISMRLVGVVYKTDIKGRYVIIMDRVGAIEQIEGWSDEDEDEYE